MMIDALVYAFQVAVVFVTTVTVTVGVLWFLSLPWRSAFGEWEPTSGTPEQFAMFVSMVMQLSVCVAAVWGLVVWSFDAVVF